MATFYWTFSSNSSYLSPNAGTFGSRSRGGPRSVYVICIPWCRLQLLEDFKWVFLLEEEKPLFNLLAPFIAASPSSRRLPSSNNSKQVEIPVASSVSYIPGRGWRCEYDRVSDDSGEGLIYDLRDVDRMGFMAKDIENGPKTTTFLHSHPYHC